MTLCLCVLLAGCGYQFTARSVPETGISLLIESDAPEPGLPILVGRALRAVSSVHGLKWVEPEPGRAQLRVMITDVSSEPLGVARFESDGGSSVAATSYRTEVVMTVVFLTRAGEEIGSERFVGVSEYEDHLVPLATEGQRRESIERATTDACEALSAWAAATLIAATSERLAIEAEGDSVPTDVKAGVGRDGESGSR